MNVVARRARVRVTGTVQGVGFRPYVYRLAGELSLGGFVLNDAHGVLIEVEGSATGVDRFLERLPSEAPPLAVLEQVLVEEGSPSGDVAFAIHESVGEGVPDAPVTPDTATCADCLRELFDPSDRRFRYPFINCTNCGPRFTIVRGVPYDRPLTTMAGFTMCPACLAEYEDPSDRRFHAQPNACPVCGPSLWLIGVDGEGGWDPIQSTASAIQDGAIVAVKGVGGYHLACRADDERAVGALRARKHREDKPFALMAPSVTVAESLVSLEGPGRALLTSPARPIVLAPRLPDAPVAASVAPGAPELGVMLPYSPLHHLLLADAGTTLVLTSGNVSDEPIAYRDDDALARLKDIADLFLVHDRPIETRTDDSVARATPRGTVLRRSRGYVPAAIPLPGPGAARAVLACGAELKNTFCLAKGKRAWVSHHIGDLENYETLRSFTDGIEHYARLFAVAPEVVAHDLHPEYLSTKYALELDDVDLVGVQHHHAHLAACLAEHGEPGPAIGAIFDGTGYGLDGTVWGGELLLGDAGAFRRVGMLRPVLLPGGAQAIRQPWRMACAWLSEALDRDPAIPATLSRRVDPRAWAQVSGLIRTGGVSPATSSMGRLFDAVAALAGIRSEVNYEGQAAVELEAAADPSERGTYPIGFSEPDGLLVIDPRETITAVAADVARGEHAGAIASRFHRAIVAATVQACAHLATVHATHIAVLSGGVFQNRLLLDSISGGLAATGLRVLVPERLPVNDGGISYGQAAVAAATIATRTAAAMTPASVTR
ncbi:MAG TPA: carbamoyltransferase HypF [Solirubrobacteraceae bacterium]|nr:carbamoyltransferase HypF [Solirubrobacteraceae bacterium]